MTAGLALAIVAGGLAVAGGASPGGLGAEEALAASSSASSDEASASGWSMDIDCTPCHQSEAASVGMGDGAEEDSDDDGEAADSGGFAEGAQEQAAGEATQDAQGAGAEGSGSEGGAASESGGSAASDGGIDAAAVTGYARMHVQSMGLTCTTCHNDEEGLAKAHRKMDSGKTAKRLKRTSVSDEVCLTCHDKEQLVAATADVTVLTDTKGTTVNPHDIPANDSHADIQCVSCHQAHYDEDETIETMAMGVCVDCHHAQVFECGTCH